MRQLTLSVSRLFNIFLVLALLSACTMGIVPQYQQSLVDGINAANVKGLTLFAAVAEGSPRSQFATYKPKYDEVIGSFDALLTEAKTRPIPALAGRLSKVSSLRELCGAEADATACVNSTSRKLEGIVLVVTEMKRIHASQGLIAPVVLAFKKDFQFSVLQALTIEASLKR